jgi:hypothetical protein
MELRTLTLTALLIATPVLASDTPSSTLAALPRLPTPATLSCDLIQPTVEHIERQTQTVSEQVQILLDQPRRSAGSDVPGEISALLDDQQVTMCVTEFGDYDWLMDLDMQLDADLGALKQDRVRLADACPMKGGFPAADCVAKIDAQLAVKAQARTDQYLRQAQAGLDAEAQRMAGCTQRRDAAAERLFQAGGFDLQATGLQVESWKLANVATKRWKGICSHARVALTSMPQG